MKKPFESWVDGGYTHIPSMWDILRDEVRVENLCLVTGQPVVCGTVDKPKFAKDCRITILGVNGWNTFPADLDFYIPYLLLVRGTQEAVANWLQARRDECPEESGVLIEHRRILLNGEDAASLLRVMFAPPYTDQRRGHGPLPSVRRFILNDRKPAMSLRDLFQKPLEWEWSRDD